MKFEFTYLNIFVNCHESSGKIVECFPVAVFTVFEFRVILLLVCLPFKARDPSLSCHLPISRRGEWIRDEFIYFHKGINAKVKAID